MVDDMGKIDKSEPCVNISGYAARDGVSKSVTELTTTRQSLNQTVEGVSTAWTNRAAHDSYFEDIPFKENVPI